MDEQVGYDYYGQFFADISAKVRDLEEKQRALKERLLLIGENLIEIKEKSREDILEIKKDVEKLKLSTERVISFIETLSAEFSNFARKEDIEILEKQIKMFHPSKLKKINKK